MESTNGLIGSNNAVEAHSDVDEVEQEGKLVIDSSEESSIPELPPLYTTSGGKIITTRGSMSSDGKKELASVSTTESWVESDSDEPKSPSSCASSRSSHTFSLRSEDFKDSEEEEAEALERREKSAAICRKYLDEIEYHERMRAEAQNEENKLRIEWSFRPGNSDQVRNRTIFFFFVQIRKLLL